MTACVLYGRRAGVVRQDQPDQPRWEPAGVPCSRQPSLLASVCMKRTNVVIDEDLLEEAVRVSGELYVLAHHRARPAGIVRRAKARAIDQLAGSGLWQGDLGEMRGDGAPVVRETRGVYRPRKRRVPR